VDSLDAGERRKAIRILSEADHPSAREALAHALEHPLADVRIAAACLYPDASDARILPGLIEAAYGNTWREYLGNKVFSDRVAEIGSAAVPGLLSALDSASEEWKPMLLEALGTVGGADVRPVLLEGLKSANDRTREAAAAAFGRSGDAEGVPALLEALGDSHATVRDAAAWSLGLLKATQGVSELSRMAVEDTPTCRVTAARALGRIGDPTAIPNLAAALEDGEVEVRRAAIEALGALGAASTIPDLRELLQQGAESEQISETDSALMMTLLQLKDAEAVPLIEARLTRFRSGLFAHVEEICVSMARFGENGVAAVIRVLENAASGSVQGKAVAALERIGSPLGAEAAKAWRRTHG
jgi:HEAT repeat protein